MKSILPFKRRLVLLSMILLGYSAQAQVATTYNFSQSAGTYTAITGGTILAGFGDMDEDIFTVSIPSFKFDGNSYTSIDISTNGYISFGYPMDAYEWNPISGYLMCDGIVSAFGTDLDEADPLAGIAQISTEQVGNEFVIQWQNVRRYDIDDEQISFQIRLNTVSNEIKVVYGGTIIPGDYDTYPEVGLRGPDYQYINNREVDASTGAWVNSLPGTDEYSTCIFDSNEPTAVPAPGTTFIWAAAPDVELQNFVFATSNECYSSTEVVSVVVKNNGGTILDFSATPLTINSAVSITNPMVFTPVIINTGTLAIGATQTIQITPSYDMSSGGSSYAFNASISMTGDAISGNNTLSKTRFNYKPTVNYPDAANCAGLGVTLNGTSNFSVINPTTNNNTPLVIPDDDPVGVTSTIVVSNAGAATAASVVATIESLTHTYTGDLTITLTAPDGSSVDLYVEEDGGDDADFINTVFSAAAADLIGDGINPYTGSFQPNSPLSGLTGPANGTWELQLADNAGFDTGKLNSWSLTFPGTNSIVSYSWTPATDLSSGTIANPVASPASTATYAVTVTDERGCTATDNVIVSVGSIPTVVASSDATGDMICEGESVILTGSGTATSFTWNNSVANGVAFEPAATTEYIVTGTGANNCSTTDTITVVVNNIPTVIASSDATGDMICEGEELVLTGSGSATSFTWNNNITDGLAFEPAATATYIVTGTDANNCSNNDTIIITVNPVPNTALALPVTELCVYNSAITLTGGSPASGSYSGTGVSAGLFNPATSGNGTFTITYSFTDGNGCSASATDDILVDACLGLEETDQVFLQVYPNPSKGVFTVSVTDANQLSGITIVDAQGKIIPFNQYGQNAGNFIIDLSDVENGVYFLQTILNGESIISRLIKQ